MTAGASPFLAPWSNFYIMTAAAAASLTGLMFVVITLTTSVKRSQRVPDGISTFSTPTVVHFCAALFLSAILIAPWRAMVLPAVFLGLAGLYGLMYMVVVARRTKQLTAYDPDLEDWAWYTMVPFVAYGAILAGAAMLVRLPEDALFVLAAGVALLIFLGIRNAWDIVTYIAIGPSDDNPSP
jgi:hypothetical protein